MSVTLMFQRPPFLPQTRTVWTPNNNFLVLDQVTMSREEAQPPKCDIRSVVSPYPLVLPYPLPRYTASCEEKGPAVPELQVWKLPQGLATRDSICSSSTAAVGPGPAGFCKFCSIPVCNIQIKDERKCKCGA